MKFLVVSGTRSVYRRTFMSPALVFSVAIVSPFSGCVCICTGVRLSATGSFSGEAWHAEKIARERSASDNIFFMVLG